MGLNRSIVGPPRSVSDVRPMTIDYPERPITGAVPGNRPTVVAGYSHRLQLRIIDSNGCLSIISSPHALLPIAGMGRPPWRDISAGIGRPARLQATQEASHAAATMVPEYLPLMTHFRPESARCQPDRHRS